jgi:hypothetical protein
MNLDRTNILGRGGFGEVYRTELLVDGVLQEGDVERLLLLMRRIQVAVKTSIFDSLEAKKELLSYVKTSWH